ncbi:hypothetical protein BHM03_00049719 [Ensete ventricosum]|nr:hypothetical protein BHM03_00049719 [Ensete ventricosum]
MGNLPSTWAIYPSKAVGRRPDSMEEAMEHRRWVAVGPWVALLRVMLRVVRPGWFTITVRLHEEALLSVPRVLFDTVADHGHDPLGSRRGPRSNGLSR